MKKTTIHKLIFFLVVIVISVSLFALPVSAYVTEETDTYVEVLNDFTHPSQEGNVLYSFGTSYVDILTDIDSQWFDRLTVGNYDVIERDINEGKYYEYVSYQYTDEDIASSSHGVFTYCFMFDRVNLSLNPDVGSFINILLNAGFLQFYGLNAIVDDVRFSIRSLEDDYVTTTWLFSDLINSGFSSSEEIGINRLYYYDGLRTVSNVTFQNDGSVDNNVLSYALCVDFLFRPRNVQGGSGPSIGINTASNLYLLNYISSSAPIGPGDPGYDPSGSRPEFDIPFFGQGNVELHNMVSSAEQQFRDALNVDTTFSDIGSFLYSNLGAFSTAFLRIGDVLGYTTSNIPYLEFVLYFGLGIGCVAFILGLAHSIIGASPEPLSEQSNREPGQRFARGLSTNRDGSSKVSGSGSYGSRSDVRFGSIGRLSSNNK